MEKHRFEDRDMLVEDLLKMLDQGSPNDVKIKLKDGEIAANKDILMARCEYFATMFSNNMFIEGGTDSVDTSHCMLQQGRHVQDHQISLQWSCTI